MAFVPSGQDSNLNGAVNILSTVTGTITWQSNNQVFTHDVTAQVLNIGEYAFNGCTGITEVSFPETLRSINWNAFDGCTNLTSVTIPVSVTTIGTQAFAFCDNLSTVIWNARRVGEPYQRHEFDPGRDGIWTGSPIKFIIIGEEVESIGNHVFDSYYYGNNYNGIERIISKAINPPVIQYYSLPFYGCTISVPVQSLQAYRSAANWSFFFINAIGDTNNDDKVNIDDVTSLIDIMLSENTSDNINADVDGDGTINISDLTTLIDKLLNEH